MLTIPAYKALCAQVTETVSLVAQRDILELWSDLIDVRSLLRETLQSILTWIAFSSNSSILFPDCL
jgi:hypothetical protein